MKKRKKKNILSLWASADEQKMIHFIMESDARNSVSDCLRNLIRERFFFLQSNANTLANNQLNNPVVADKE